MSRFKDIKNSKIQEEQAAAAEAQRTSHDQVDEEARLLKEREDKHFATLNNFAAFMGSIDILGIFKDLSEARGVTTKPTFSVKYHKPDSKYQRGYIASGRVSLSSLLELVKKKAPAIVKDLFTVFGGGSHEEGIIKSFSGYQLIPLQFLLNRKERQNKRELEEKEIHIDEISINYFLKREFTGLGSGGDGDPYTVSGITISFIGEEVGVGNLSLGAATSISEQQLIEIITQIVISSK